MHAMVAQQWLIVGAYERQTAGGMHDDLLQLGLGPCMYSIFGRWVGGMLLTPHAVCDLKE